MPRKMREMVGGCCVCSDERGWDENPLVYCDGQGCNVAVHQACYGIVTVPTGPWFCRKCESQERSARLRCELCPNKDGALKRTDSNSWAHVVCALYIPEVRFGNVATMEPIVLGLVPQERYQKVCYLCELQGRESRASTGACMQCNKSGCKQTFHVTCAQIAGLLCEEAGNYLDNVKYCGYCEYHYQRINRRVVKTIPAFKPVPSTAGEGHSSSDDDRDGGHGSSSSRSKSPKETTANQGRNSSLSSSPAVITSSKRGKKSNSINSSSGSSKRISIGHVVTSGSSCASAQPLSSSSTLTTTEPSPSTGEPDKGDGRSGSVSLSIRRSQNDEADANKTASSPSGECAAKSTLADQCSSTSSCSGSNAADADKKPPSVIVKFGKQDGTYYSKKQEVMPKKDKTYNKSPSTSSNHSTNCKDGGVSSATSSSVVTASPTVPSNDKMSRNMVLSTASLDRLPPPTSVFTPMPPESIKKEVLTVDLKNSQVESSLNEVSSSRNDKSQELKSFNASADYSKDMKQDITSATSTAASVSMNASSNSLRSPMSVTAPMPSVSEPKDINQISISNASSALLTDTEIKQERISRPVSPSRLTTELLNAGAIKRSASGKRLGRPPKKGTHLCADSLAPLSLTMAQQESADHSPERGGDAADEAKRRRRSPNKKLLTNGADPTSSIWMMGATLNPNSTIAKEMDVCLREEVETHNSFEPAQKSAHHGVPLPKKKGGSETGVGVNSGSGHVPSGAKGQPQTLEELLERQWEQGSQFLMEQASHFDIASLLSSLHQLKEENNDIEDSIDRLIQRRDHLLAVRARLMALSSLSLSPTTASNHTTPERAHHANLHQQHTNGPSPSSSGRSSAHVSPRNSAATVSPIRVERAATIISPRNLSLPTSSASSLISPRAVSSASSGSSAQQIQLPSPRDRLPPPLENGIDNYHHNPAILPPPPPPQQASAPPSSSALSSTLPGCTTSTNSYSISSSQAGLSSRTAHLLTNSRMPVVGCTSANSLLTVASSAVSCSVASSSSATLSHHRHSIQNTPPPPPPQVVLSMPTTSTSGITPPPMSRHSSYPAASSSLSVSSRIAGHSLPTDPRGSGNTMMRPPMLPHHAFPASGYHSSGRDHPSSSAAAHGHARLSAASTTDTTTILAMAAAQHSIRSAAAAAHLMDKR